MVLHQIVEGTGVEFYRISDLVLMNDNHADKMIYVEFYMLPRDELSTDESLTVSAASEKLNQTINSDSFRNRLFTYLYTIFDSKSCKNVLFIFLKAKISVDMSGFTGKADKFTGIPESLGRYIL